MRCFGDSREALGLHLPLPSCVAACCERCLSPQSLWSQPLLKTPHIQLSCGVTASSPPLLLHYLLFCNLPSVHLLTRIADSNSLHVADQQQTVDLLEACCSLVSWRWPLSSALHIVCTVLVCLYVLLVSGWLVTVRWAYPLLCVWVCKCICVNALYLYI